MMFTFSDYMPGLSIDCVIFGFHDNELRVLLLKMKNWDAWALPGGFVRKDQDVDAGAIEVLRQRTGLDEVYLRQFHIFGNNKRSEKQFMDRLVSSGVVEPEDKDWFAQRFVTIGYYALVEYSKVSAPSIDEISEAIAWCPLADVPSLVLDHQDILACALQTLRQELQLRPIGINLLPNKFTMPELQGVYEAILGKKLDRRNFRRKMLSYDLVVDTGEKRMGKAHKAPIIYRFDEEKYQLAVERGLKGSFG